uniref:ASAP1 protein n=1 Tax=Homo sapiens TaxID=9606 RepID=Q8WWA4_HUMAN
MNAHLSDVLKHPLHPFFIIFLVLFLDKFKLLKDYSR